MSFKCCKTEQKHSEFVSTLPTSTLIEWVIQKSTNQSSARRLKIVQSRPQVVYEPEKHLKISSKCRVLSIRMVELIDFSKQYQDIDKSRPNKSQSAIYVLKLSQSRSKVVLSCQKSYTPANDNEKMFDSSILWNDDSWASEAEECIVYSSCAAYDEQQIHDMLMQHKQSSAWLYSV